MTHAVILLLFLIHDPDPELPGLEEFAGLPTWEEADEMESEWRHCLEWLEDAIHAWSERREPFWDCMTVCRRNIDVWLEVKDCLSDNRSLAKRRRSLEGLRLMLGDEAYLLRQFPRLPPRGPDRTAAPAT